MTVPGPKNGVHYKASGNGSERYYSLEDPIYLQSVISPRYYYRLKQVDYDGTAYYAQVIYVDIPEENPFTAGRAWFTPEGFAFDFSLSGHAGLSYKLTDQSGRHIAGGTTAISGAGNHTYHISLTGMNTGVYYLRLEANGRETTQRVVKH